MNDRYVVKEQSYTSRAILVGAMVGATASVANQWKASKTGAITTNEYIKSVTTDTLKASAISGATTYAAIKMAKKPVLSMATILTVAVASAYLLSAKSDVKESK